MKQKMKNNDSFCVNIPQKGLWHNLSINRTAYLLILPALFLVLLLCYLPFGGLLLAFKDYNIVDGILGSPWVGFNNFIECFTQPNMLIAHYHNPGYNCGAYFVLVKQYVPMERHR